MYIKREVFRLKIEEIRSTKKIREEKNFSCFNFESKIYVKSQKLSLIGQNHICKEVFIYFCFKLLLNN